MSLFRVDMNRLIGIVLDPADELAQFRNVGTARSTGVELEVQGRWTNGVRARGSLAWEDSENRKEDARLPNSPKHLLKVGLTVPVAGRFDLSGQVRYESERRSLEGETLGSWLAADVHMTTEPLFGNWRVSLHALNVFDEENQAPGGLEHLQLGIPQPGRQLRIGIEGLF